MTKEDRSFQTLASRGPLKSQAKYNPGKDLEERYPAMKVLRAIGVPREALELRARLSTEETLEKYGAGERIRTVDLRIPSAPSRDLAEPPESQNPQNIEIPETEGNTQDP